MFKILHLPTGYITYKTLNSPNNLTLARKLSAMPDMFTPVYLTTFVLPKYMKFIPYAWNDVWDTIYVECDTELQAKQIMYKLCRYRNYTKDEFEIHEY